MSTAEWERLLFLNLLAPIVVTRALIPTLLAQDEAHVLNGCSIFGLVPAKRGRLPSQQVWFGGLSAALRAEYGSDFGVTSLCPGFVRTPLLSNFATDQGKKRHEIPPGSAPPAQGGHDRDPCHPPQQGLGGNHAGSAAHMVAGALVAWPRRLASPARLARQAQAQRRVATPGMMWQSARVPSPSGAGVGGRRDRLDLAASILVVRRRQVFYVEGYDPRGAAGYYDLFARAWKRSRGAWGLEGKLGELVLDSELIAHWDIDAAGPSWRVVTRYEFLRLEGIIAANVAEPMWRQIPRALAWAIEDHITGTTARIFRAAWRFELHLLYFQVLLLLWLLLSLGGGVVAAMVAGGLAGLPGLLAAVVGTVAAIGCFVGLRPLADRLQVVQVNSCWPYLREFARGEASAFDRPIDVYAARIVAAARAAQSEEIVVIGHSAAGVTAPAVIARALELDPQLGAHGPRLVLLTLGSVMPAAALHPAAQRMRGVIARLATEPSVTWINCVSRKDVMNFWDFDPVAGVVGEAGAARCNPLVWPVSFKEVVSPEYYKRLRRSLFRLHYQFIMSGDRPASYDYVMLVAGPFPVAEWAKDPQTVAAALAPDGAFAGAAKTTAAQK